MAMVCGAVPLWRALLEVLMGCLLAVGISTIQSMDPRNPYTQLGAVERKRVDVLFVGLRNIMDIQSRCTNIQ